MLQYTRRTEIVPKINHSSVELINELDNDPILTYCNWSYKKNKQLTSKKLVSIIKRFDEKKLPYYVRIFNETPVSTIKYFLNNHDLSDNNLKIIWEETSKIKGVRLRRDFWKKYYSSKAS